MSSLKNYISSLSILLALTIAARPTVGEAQSIAGKLIVVPANKLPQEAHHQGQAMDLHLVNPSTLYLYVEQEDGKQIAIFDVSDPQKIKFKKLVALEAPAAFDFVQPAGQSLELIRYRDGQGIAILDLSRPKNPLLKTVGATGTEFYIVPVESNQASTRKLAAPQDYQIIRPTASEAVAVVKAVVQQQTDEGNGTIYLLGADGLTVIRNVRTEKSLTAMSPAWTNTIDDNKNICR
jgi:hypothetical protein